LPQYWGEKYFRKYCFYQKYTIGKLLLQICYTEWMGMAFILNKEIVFQLVEEFDLALSNSRKSRDEIFNTLVSQNPEITCSSDEWEDFSQDIKDSIINRVKKTLSSM
jgi:hypothetical protein